MQIVRWILFFPVSVICGYVAYAIGGAVNNFSVDLLTGHPPEGLMKIIMDAAAYLYLGAVTTFVAVKIAPSRPSYVAAGIFVFLLIFAGVTVVPSVAVDTFYAVSTIIGLFLGCVGIQVGIFIGEIAPFRGKRK